MKSDEIARRDIIKTIALSPVTLLPLVGSNARATPAGSYSPKFFSAGRNGTGGYHWRTHPSANRYARRSRRGRA